MRNALITGLTALTLGLGVVSCSEDNSSTQPTTRPAETVPYNEPTTQASNPLPTLNELIKQRKQDALDKDLPGKAATIAMELGTKGVQRKTYEDNSFHISLSRSVFLGSPPYDYHNFVVKFGEKIVLSGSLETDRNFSHSRVYWCPSQGDNITINNYIPGSGSWEDKLGLVYDRALQAREACFLGREARENEEELKERKQQMALFGISEKDIKQK